MGTKSAANTMKIELSEKKIESFENINIVIYEPPKEIVNGYLAIWLPYLGGNKNTVDNELKKLGDYGFYAISFDPWLHGDRKDNNRVSIRTRALKNFREIMWTIIGMTTLDAYRICDWAIDKYRIKKGIVAGGISMGGDIAISLAGIDTRIKKVATLGSTPDWNRLGMTDVLDSQKIINQGNANKSSDYLRNLLNPIENIKKYDRDLAMLLEMGEKDTHIRYESAIEFSKKVNNKNIEVSINKGCNHLSLIQKKGIIQKSIDYLGAL